MRAQSLSLAAVGLTLLAPTAPPAVAPQAPAPRRAAAHHEGSVLSRPEHSVGRVDAGARGPAPPMAAPRLRAADLLERVRNCTPVSHGRFRADDGARATVPVCGTRGAVFWKTDMDIDCDGLPSPRCNDRTDPVFNADTAYRQSDGRPLSAERLPYIVVPAASRLWNPRGHGVRGASVAAVIYRDRVQYAVVGDTGPGDVIGEASYATAKGLGIRTDPQGGGAPSGVTYIVFKDSQARPIEDHAAAMAAGERLARLFVRGDGPAAGRPGARDARVAVAGVR